MAIAFSEIKYYEDGSGAYYEDEVGERYEVSLIKMEFLNVTSRVSTEILVRSEIDVEDVGWVD